MGDDQLRAAEPLTAACVVVVAAAVVVVVDGVVVLAAVVVVVDGVVVLVLVVVGDVVVLVVVSAVVVVVGVVVVDVVVGAGSDAVDVVVVAGAVVLDATATGAATLTVTSNLPLLRLPEKSAAPQLTDVVPGANTLPEAGVHWAAALASTRSLADTAKLTGTPPLSTASAVTVPGKPIVGATVSKTPTVKLPVTLLPALSRASQITEFEPSVNPVPLAGLQLTLTLRSTLSLALTAKLTVAPALDVASTRMLAGSVSTGGVVSHVVLPLLLLVRCASVGAASTAVRLRQRAARRAVFTVGMGNS